MSRLIRKHGQKLHLLLLQRQKRDFCLLVCLFIYYLFMGWLMEGICVSVENGDPGMLTLIKLETSCKWIPSGELIESGVIETMRRISGFGIGHLFHKWNKKKKTLLCPFSCSTMFDYIYGWNTQSKCPWPIAAMWICASYDIYDIIDDCL